MSVLVVTEVLSIASEKVTVMLSLIETALRLSVGEIFETVGAVLSITIALFAASDPEAPGDGRVRFASMETVSRIVELLSDNESVALKSRSLELSPDCTVYRNDRISVEFPLT